MSFSVGIIGLPNVGKSTLFKALTKIPVDIANYPFTTIHPNVGVVHVPDKRLEEIAKVIKPEKTTPTIIEFVDIAGLVKGAHKGEGLGNQFLAHIRNCDALVEIVREFENDKVEHVDGAINPEKDIETVRIELLMKDLETLEGLLSKTEKDKSLSKKTELLQKIKDWISQDRLISELDLTEEEKLETKEYQFLTKKPLLYVLNTDGKAEAISSIKYLAMNLKDEQDFSELSPEERQELNLKSNLDQLTTDCYNILDLITFFTVAGLKETRAWTLKKGLTAYLAGGVVHSDFQEKFIKAEVINWQKLMESENWHKARELGRLKTAGKDYIIQDGDVIEFKI
ncbi:MAG TPA: redox-regulated ATPase YchF [Candidatus Paceibacterota bacterium]|nr:redox-regulated ATPase YchF [Candidatus Paceibacterota bacterium]